jgi:SAM-dependent methyltransferase
MKVRPRIWIARSLVTAGRFVQSLALMVMRPDDLIEFGRRTYSETEGVDGWTAERLVDSGLMDGERELVDSLPLKQGHLLLLGVGGGREAIPLARMGFRVTGVDFVPAMVRRAEDNARRRGVPLTGVVQEISRIDFPAESFDVIILSAAMYSCVPTRRRRVEMLRRIRLALKPGGFFLCQFHWDPEYKPNPRGEIIRKIIAFLSLGNLEYERGDMLWGSAEFIHAFGSEEEARREFSEGEFELVKLHLPDGTLRGGAVLKKLGEKAWT